MMAHALYALMISMILCFLGGSVVAEALMDARSPIFPNSPIIGFPNPVSLPSSADRVLKIDRKQEGSITRIILSADVLFDFDKSELRPDSGVHLNRIVEAHRSELSGSSIVVEGHTDSKGSLSYNQRLSRARARTIANWLASQTGLKFERILELGFGEIRPRAPNAHADGRDDPVGRQRNRRVEILIRR